MNASFSRVWNGYHGNDVMDKYGVKCGKFDLKN